MSYWMVGFQSETRFEATRAQIAADTIPLANPSLRATTEGQCSLLNPFESVLGKAATESILELLELPGFFRDANCEGQDPTLFDGETLRDILEAKKICNECPIRVACASWAIRTQDFGIWGSLTPGERRKKAKGVEVIDIAEVHQLETRLEKLVSNSPIEQLAVEFKVTKRTIYRWREKILATNITNKKVI